MEKVVAFLDTNIFLHYQPFNQVNWLNELSSTEVDIAIAPIVIRELDHHKDQHSNSKIRNRARASLKKIESVITGQGGVNLLKGIRVIHIDEPSLSFTDYGLRDDVNDDHLIACCIERKSLEYDEKVVLITGDTGPRIKAHKHDIEFFDLEESLKLPNSDDEDEKEKKELENKLQKLQNSIPNLQLGFKDGDQHIIFKISEPIEIDRRKVEEKIEELKSEYPKQFPEKPDLDLPPGLSHQLAQIRRSASLMPGFGKPSEEEYERYNSELDDYFKSYEEYFYKVAELKNKEIRTIKIEVVLFNRGTAPASDIDIFMHFPDGFILHNEDDLPDPIEPPNPPIEPMSSLEKMNSYSFGLPLSHAYRPNYSNIPISNPNISSVNIKKSNSYDVEYSVMKLKQHLNAPCDVLYVYFEERKDINSFGIDYRINAANIPHEIKGKLNVVIEDSYD